MELLVATFGLAVIAAIVWLVFAPQKAFTIRVSGGVAAQSQGMVTDRFLATVEDVCRQHQVLAGTVRGLIRRGRIALAFSNEFPPEAQQQLRNWWAESGWGGPKPSGGKPKLRFRR